MAAFEIRERLPYLSDKDDAEFTGIALHRVVREAKARFAEAGGAVVNDFTMFADTLVRTLSNAYQGTQMEFDVARGGGDVTPEPSVCDLLGYREDSLTFETEKAYGVTGPKTLDPVPAGKDYPPHAPTQTTFERTMLKYGRIYNLVWEAWKRDSRDLRAIMQHVNDWGLSTAYTREYVFTAKWMENTTFFTTAQGNYMEGANTALSETSLDAARVAFNKLTDPSGNSLASVQRPFLVVPDALWSTAINLVRSQQFVGGSSKLPSSNPHAGRYNVVCNSVLDALGCNAKSWYLWAPPASGRRAVRYGYLDGHPEQGEMWVKSSLAQALNGGRSSDFEGSFENDTIAFKLRSCFGCDLWDWRGAMWVKGEA